MAPENPGPFFINKFYIRINKFRYFFKGLSFKNHPGFTLFQIGDEAGFTNFPGLGFVWFTSLHNESTSGQIQIKPKFKIFMFLYISALLSTFAEWMANRNQPEKILWNLKIYTWFFFPFRLRCFAVTLCFIRAEHRQSEQVPPATGQAAPNAMAELQQLQRGWLHRTFRSAGMFRGILTR